MSTQLVLSVSQLNNYIKSQIDSDEKLKGIFVNGEISNFKRNYSGHLYFSLKDSESVVSIVMFKGYASRLRFEPENGMKVILSGNVSVYTPSGQYQIQCMSMQPDGIGSLTLAFEQLKAKLEREGLFDPEHKREIPSVPKRIGVITSATGAVIRDIINVVSRRYPLAEIVLCPVSVQGETAPPQMIAALKQFNSMNDIDVLIIGRGGGSLEDLYCFNDEMLVREIYKSKIPVISAVGHETDFTLCDFAADRRAPTPSAAAEIAVPDRNELIKSIMLNYSIIKSCIDDKIKKEYQSIDMLSERLQSLGSAEKLEREREKIKSLSEMIETVVRNKIKNEFSIITLLADKTESLSPMRLLRRGYSVVYKESTVISSVKSIDAGDNIKIRMFDGVIECSVTDRNINENGECCDE